MRKIETLMDITIEDFLKITNLQSTDEAFVRKELIKHFKLEDMNVVDFENFLNELQLILKQDAKFIQRFTLNGIDYGFVPNLDNIKTKEWVDIDLYQADPQSIHKLLSILYRPIKKQKWYHRLFNKDRYEIEEYNGSHNNFLQAPIEIYLGMMVFFYRLRTELLTTTITYIQKQVIAETKTNSLDTHQKLNLLKSLDGIR